MHIHVPAQHYMAMPPGGCGVLCMHTHRRQRGQLNHEMREGENKVNMLRSSRSDQLLTHGPWMPALVKAVQAAQSQFRKPPKGPIGA